MGYAVYRKTEAGLKAVSRGYARRSAAESRKHVLARERPEWAAELDVREQQAVERNAEGERRR